MAEEIREDLIGIDKAGRDRILALEAELARLEAKNADLERALASLGQLTQGGSGDRVEGDA